MNRILILNYIPNNVLGMADILFNTIASRFGNPIKVNYGTLNEYSIQTFNNYHLVIIIL